MVWDDTNVDEAENASPSLMEKSDRNYGVDAVKIIAMLMVVILHILGKSNLLNGTVRFSPQYDMAWFLEIAAYCAVNCFAIATGYLLVDKGFNFSRIMLTWLQVICYTIPITTIVFVFQHEAIGITTFYEDIKKAVFPVMYKEYWYVTAYFGVYIFHPFLNKLINALSQKEMKRMCVVAILLFSIMPTIFMNDAFGTGNGYSFLWLSVMYVIGAYIKKYHPFAKVRSLILGGVYAASIVFTWLSKLIIAFISLRVSGEVKYDNFFVAYTSPTILLSAIALVMAFIKMRIPNKLRGVISKVSSLSFAVYLIHEVPYIRYYVMPYSRFFGYSNYNPLLMAVCVIGTACVVFLVCIMIERVRLLVFELLKVKKWVNMLDCKIRKMV